jgi:hypothetical protein
LRQLFWSRLNLTQVVAASFAIRIAGQPESHRQLFEKERGDV